MSETGIFSEHIGSIKVIIDPWAPPDEITPWPLECGTYMKIISANR